MCVCRSEDKALGWNEFWEKMSPEAKDWYANVVHIFLLFVRSNSI